MSDQVTFACIVLNEAEFIGKWLAQHAPLCDRIIIVEGADRRYPVASKDGLSVDGTADIVREFMAGPLGRKVQFIQHGWADSKAELRNEYAKRIDGGLVFVPDADEFLSRRSVEMTIELLNSLSGPGCVRIPIVHAWKSMDQVIEGGYWSIPHNRCYRWDAGLGYANDEHNHPQYSNGTLLCDVELKRMPCDFFVTGPGKSTVSMGEPFIWHMGFCRHPDAVQAKNTYYLRRGEAATRPNTTRDRAAWFHDKNPDFTVTWKWTGPWPEVWAPK